MVDSLLRLKKHLALTVTLSFILTPVVAYSVASIFNMPPSADFFFTPFGLILAGICVLQATWVFFFSYNFLNPVLNWLKEQAQTEPNSYSLPEKLSTHLHSFSTTYWSFFLSYILFVPTIHFWFIEASATSSTYNSLLLFMLLNLVIAVIVAMPGYFYALNLLGMVSRYTGLAYVHVSMRTKILLIGGFIPLLMTTIFLKYYWWKTGYLPTEILFTWGLLGLTAFITTSLFLYGFNQALSPVEQITTMHHSAASHERLAERLSPRSTDEMGFLVQMLGNLFRRLGDQEAHVHAIVEHAAEGIIILNSHCNIESINPAAEKLFGFKFDEMRARNFNWLIPSFKMNPHDYIEGEHEVEAQHRNGQILIMSLRMTQMIMDTRVFYNCLISDISERKATEKMLMQATARYRDLVETAHDLVWSMDNKGRWTYLNKAVVNIYGYAAEEMLFKHYSNYQLPESRERDLTALKTLFSGKEIVGYETVHLDKQGNRVHISFNAKPTLSADGSVAYISGTARDITSKKAYENELTYQAQHDSLTGIYNRKFFQQELERVVSRVARSAADCAIFYMDLDQFKYVNDTIGHAAGDNLLLESTNLLRSHLREGDLLARFGGDEFTVLLYNLDRTEACSVAEGIRKLFEHYQFVDSGKSFNVTISLGIACITNQTLSAEEVLSQADIACNIAKTNGRNRIHIAEPGKNEKDGLSKDMGWADRVRDAFENDRFTLVFQPIISVADGTVNDYEVLLRMQRENGEVILPGGFMPAAERFGLVHNVDRWAVTRAITYLDELTTKHNTKLRFAINLSGSAFEDKELFPLIRGLINDSQLSPSQITFEITETAAIANLRNATHFITKLKDLGCEFALDDFGSGFCSFNYLKRLPVDKLKIDGNFVKNLASAHIDQAMVQSMNQIAHALGKKTIAEFVENHQTLLLLKSYGVDFAQGNFIGIPSPHIHLSENIQHSYLEDNSEPVF
ncbi:EAL domain-containing protein [Beggiatoa alba]|nr:EAL domain-containing protein [Beggiatoa alba]